MFLRSMLPLLIGISTLVVRVANGPLENPFEILLSPRYCTLGDCVVFKNSTPS